MSGFFSSRYHGCVASLSAGVPTIVVGWHNKYNELMALYNQSGYIVEQDKVSASVLIEKFEEIYANKDAISQELLKKNQTIKDRMYNAYKEEFGK